VGAVLAVFIVRALYPDVAESAGEVIVPHHAHGAGEGAQHREAHA
jgi:hypothetical protein